MVACLIAITSRHGLAENIWGSNPPIAHFRQWLLYFPFQWTSTWLFAGSHMYLGCRLVTTNFIKHAELSEDTCLSALNFSSTNIYRLLVKWPRGRGFMEATSTEFVVFNSWLDTSLFLPTIKWESTDAVWEKSRVGVSICRSRFLTILMCHRHGQMAHIRYQVQGFDWLWL